MVEVDASDVGVGAVLSQRSGDDQELHPCAFFSRHLTPAERNYDLSNRELLAPRVVTSISEPILRSSCIVGAAIWQVEEQVCEVLCSSRLPTPCSSPTLPALRWGDASKLACPPGLSTLHLLRQRFWWPSMVHNARAFIADCPVCA